MHKLFCFKPVGFLLIILTSLFVLSASLQAAGKDTGKDKDTQIAEQADAAYAQKNYAEAMESYGLLARKGDAFSQYRVSYMHLLGEGVDIDYPEAFAWAVLAAESQNEQLHTYFTEVQERVPPGQRDAAQALAEDYLHRWGRLQLAIEGRKKADQQLRNCTGSRLGTRCEEVYARQMPKFWKISPGAGDGTDGGGAAPSGSVSGMAIGSGGETRDGEHYAELREARDQLDQYITNNAGSVELGDFEVIEPQPSENDTE